QFQSNSEIIIGNNYQLATTAVLQAAPTCSVSAGGTVAVNSYTFRVAPVFPGGGEGILSPASSTCTTSGGNQTVTIQWATVAGATGYDLYENNVSFQCGSPWVSGGNSTQYVWSGAAACGGGAPTLSGSGPSGLNSLFVWSPQATVSGNGFKTDITAPLLTASRTVNLPDASGVVVVDAALALQANTDNFNRANGGLGTSWTTFGTFTAPT